MACKQSTEKSTGGGLDISSISSILNMIKSVFKSTDTPSLPIPSALILANSKCGLVAGDIASKVISRLPEAGITNGDDYKDGPNAASLLVRIMSEEIVSSLQTQASVQVAINPGVKVSGTGIGNFGAPVAVQGATTEIATGKGIKIGRAHV